MNFNIVMNPYNNLLEIGCDENEIFSVMPLLKQELNVLMEMPLLNKTKIETQCILDCIIDNWVNHGLMYKIGNKWKINTVEIVAKELGYSIVRFNPISIGLLSAISSTRKHVLAECLVNPDGNLNPQFKKMPAKLIEWFENLIDDEILDSAVERHKNEIIAELARIK